MSRRDYLLNIARLAQSYGFVPIGTQWKIPRFRNWQQVRYDPADPDKNIRRIAHLYDAKLVNNVGILTGAPSGVVVMDIEVSGLPWWNELVRINGGFPETFTVQTGSCTAQPYNFGGKQLPSTCGLHVYFKYDSRVAPFRNMNRILNQSVDFRTTGGHVLFPGSVSKSGETYKVLAGYREGRPIIAEMPVWLIELLQLNREE